MPKRVSIIGAAVGPTQNVNFDGIDGMAVDG